jgi:hypothetical protein
MPRPLPYHFQVIIYGHGHSNEMSGACSTYGGEESFLQGFGGET